MNSRAASRVPISRNAIRVIATSRHTSTLAGSQRKSENPARYSFIKEMYPGQGHFLEQALTEWLEVGTVAEALRHNADQFSPEAR
jgi:hypothetical protein